jgi:hypothetical protein
MEKSHQILYVRFIGAYVYAVDIVRSKPLFQLFQPLGSGDLVFSAKTPARCVDEHGCSGLGVLEFNQTDGCQCPFGWIIDDSGDDIVAIVQEAHGFFEIFVYKI